MLGHFVSSECPSAVTVHLLTRLLAVIFAGHRICSVEIIYVERLRCSKVLLDCHPQSGRTALMAAARFAKVDTMRILLDAGADRRAEVRT